MALTDPQVYTVSGVDKTMPRISTGQRSATYQTSDQSFKLDVSHRQARVDKKLRLKSFLVFTNRKIVADPLTSVNDFDQASVSVLFDRPEAGWTIAEFDALVQSVKAELTTAYVTQILGQES